MARKEVDRVRLMVAVAPELLKKLQELAKIDGRPLAYFAGMMIALSSDREGKRSFASWLRKRIVSGKPKAEHIGMRQLASVEKERILVLVEKDAIQDVERIAEVMDCTVVKLAGLLLDHAADAQVNWIKFFASPFGKPFLRLAGGRPSFDKPAGDFPEYKGMPWMDEDNEEATE